MERHEEETQTADRGKGESGEMIRELKRSVVERVRGAKYPISVGMKLYLLQNGHIQARKNRTDKYAFFGWIASYPDADREKPIIAETVIGNCQENPVCLHRG